jgi:hypothetical protein
VTRPAGWYPDPDESGGKGKVIACLIAAVVVLVVERAPVVADPGFPDLQKAAQGEYVLVKMTVTNVSAEPQTFFASFNTLSDGTTEFRSDDEAWIYLGNTLADLTRGIRSTQRWFSMCRWAPTPSRSNCTTAHSRRA